MVASLNGAFVLNTGSAVFADEVQASSWRTEMMSVAELVCRLKKKKVCRLKKKEVWNGVDA